MNSLEPQFKCKVLNFNKIEKNLKNFASKKGKKTSEKEVMNNFLEI